MNVELKIRKDGGQAARSAPGGQNIDRGRNVNPGNGMNRNGSGGRGDRREERGGGNRQFTRSDRAPLGPRNGGNANGTSAATYNNTRR